MKKKPYALKVGDKVVGVLSATDYEGVLIEIAPLSRFPYRVSVLDSGVIPFGRDELRLVVKKRKKGKV